MTRLIKAIKKDDVGEALRLIEAVTNVNLADRFGDTPLNWAVMFGSIKIVRALIKAGADVNPVNRWSDAPLYQAVKEGHVDTVEMLLTNGADVNQANKKAHTPLYKAILKGHVEVVRLLLGHENIDVNRANQFGYTPLYWAVYNGHVDIVRLLLERGADINRATKKGKTPLSIATERGNKEIVDLLEEGSVISLRVISLYEKCESSDGNSELKQQVFDDAVRLKDYFVEHILDLANDLIPDEAINLLEDSIAVDENSSNFNPSNYVSKVIHTSRGPFSSVYNPNTNSAIKIRDTITRLKLSMENEIEEEEEKENITNPIATSLTSFSELFVLPPEDNINDIELSEVVGSSERVAPGLGNNNIDIPDSNSPG